MIKIANEGLVWAGTSKNWFAQVIRGFIGLAPVIGPATTAIGGFLTGATKIFTVTKQAAHGLYAMAKGAVNLVAKLLPIGGRGKTAGAGLEETAKSSRNAGKSAGESSGSIMQLGLAILEIGAGVGLSRCWNIISCNCCSVCLNWGNGSCWQASRCNGAKRSNGICRYGSIGCFV